MNYTQLEVLIALAECGSFTEAADQVGMTQAGASASLAKLEAELDVTLVKRSRSGLSLTSVGEQILGEARLVRLHLETIRQVSARERGLARGKFRLGSLAVFSAQLTVHILSAFQRAYPDIEVAMFEGSADEVIEWIDTQVVDVGFVLHPNPSVNSVLLMRDTLKLVVSPQNPLAGRSTVTFADLDEETLIVAQHGHDFFRSPQGLALPRQLQPRFQVSEIVTALAMIRENMGVALLPSIVIPNTTESLPTLDLKPSVEIPLGLGVHSLNRLTPSAELFIEHTQTWCRRYMEKKLATPR